MDGRAGRSSLEFSRHGRHDEIVAVAMKQRERQKLGPGFRRGDEGRGHEWNDVRRICGPTHERSLRRDGWHGRRRIAMAESELHRPPAVRCPPFPQDEPMLRHTLIALLGTLSL